MRSTILASAALLATSAFAWPQGPCVNYNQALVVANNFKTLISAYSNESANAFLCDNVHDYSDSVITLIDGGCPSGPSPPFIALGSPTFTSRANFEAGQGGQPNITFDILNVWHNCDTVIVRWKSPTPNPGPVPPPPAVQEQVTGIIVLEVSFNGWQSAQPWLIDTIYSEFNSGAWLYDLDVFQPANCSTAASKKLKIKKSM